MDDFREVESPASRYSVDKRLLDQLLLEAFAERSEAAGKDIVLVIGNSGSGKSTTINYLLGCPMELQEQGARDVIVVKPGTKEYAVISDSICYSQTLYPSVFQMPGDYYLCECPDFIDARGPEYEITAALSTKVTIDAARRIKGIVVVIGQSSIMGEGRWAGLCRIFGTLQRLLSQIPASQKEVVDLERLKNSITFVITKPCFTLTGRKADTRKLLERIKCEHINIKTEKSQNIVFMCDLMLVSNGLIEIDPLDDGESRIRLMNCFNQSHLLLPGKLGLAIAENVRRILQEILLDKIYVFNYLIFLQGMNEPNSCIKSLPHELIKHIGFLIFSSSIMLPLHGLYQKISAKVDEIYLFQHDQIENLSKTKVSPIRDMETNRFFVRSSSSHVLPLQTLIQLLSLIIAPQRGFSAPNPFLSPTFFQPTNPFHSQQNNPFQTRTVLSVNQNPFLPPTFFQQAIPNNPNLPKNPTPDQQNPHSVIKNSDFQIGKKQF